jgi:hypothetical protein
MTEIRITRQLLQTRKLDSEIVPGGIGSIEIGSARNVAQKTIFPWCSFTANRRKITQTTQFARTHRFHHSTRKFDGITIQCKHPAII